MNLQSYQKHALSFFFFFFLCWSGRRRVMFKCTSPYHQFHQIKAVYPANGRDGPACFLELHSSLVYMRRVQHAYQVQHSVCILSLFFVRTENPTSHLYVVVKGISNSMLALLKTGYSDEMLTQNDDNVMDSCLFLSVWSLLSCNSSVSSEAVSPSSSSDSGLSKSKGFWIHLLSCKMSYLSLGK